MTGGGSWNARAKREEMTAATPTHKGGSVFTSPQLAQCLLVKLPMLLLIINFDYYQSFQTSVPVT